MLRAREKNQLIAILGFICIFYWLFDFTFNALLTHHFSWLLWYSSIGLLATGIALISQNQVLLYSLFCALFVIESVWTIDFFIMLVFDTNLFGFATYTRFLDFTNRDFYLALYHILIPISLLFAISKIRRIYKYGWIGATAFASVLSFLTFFLAGPHDRVNCISDLSNCQTLFSFLYKINNPYRVFAALFLLVFLVYIPTNYLLIKFKRKQLKKT